MSKISSLFKLAYAGFVFSREGVVSTLPREALPAPARFIHRLAGLIRRRRSKKETQSTRLSNALNRLGPSWVKLGQFLATRPDVVGTQMALDLELLQDRMKPFDTEKARKRVEDSLGRTVDEIFDDFSGPVAAASIAQVHKAKRKTDGKHVAVKIVRPGVRQRFFRDLESFYFASQTLERFSPASKRLKPVAVTDMLAQSARIEMDLRLEAAALSEMGENIKTDPGFRVPQVDWELSGRDCLTLEWVDGIKLGDVKELERHGHDLKALGATLIQSFLRHTLRDGFFHADMHPGNLFVDQQGVIVGVDMGIVGRLGKKERRFLAEILYGFITQDYIRVAEVHFEAGYVPKHHDVASFAQAIRAIGEPIHGQSASTISMAKLLMLLFEVTELFDMEARPELLLLQKTMVVVEGVARKLDPEFNMWKTAEPVVGDWIRNNLGPVAIVSDLKEGARAGLALARQLPELKLRSEILSEKMAEMVENGFQLDEQTVKQIGKAEARHSRLGHLALWAIAVLLGFIAFKLL